MYIYFVDVLLLVTVRFRWFISSFSGILRILTCKSKWYGKTHTTILYLCDKRLRLFHLLQRASKDQHFYQNRLSLSLSISLAPPKTDNSLKINGEMVMIHFFLTE